MVNDQEESKVECVTDEAAGEVKNDESTADAANNANGENASNDVEASAELLEKIKSQVEVYCSRFSSIDRSLSCIGEELHIIFVFSRSTTLAM